MISVAISAVVLLGYVTDAVNYYQPRTVAGQEHTKMLAEAKYERAKVLSWSELEMIQHKIEVLELKIQRIVDRAEAQSRPLTLQEEQEIASYRAEIQLHHNRRNAILAEH